MSLSVTVDEEPVHLPADVGVDLSGFKKVRIEWISYKVGDLDAAIKQAVSELVAVGFTPVDSDDANVQVYSKDDSLFWLASSVDCRRRCRSAGFR